MRTGTKYKNNPFGLSPAFLSICEIIGKSFAESAQKRQQAQREAQIEDTTYEVVEPKQLPMNTEDWSKPENDHWDNY
ncbi:MAG: hypothetical protein U0X91_30680 [Spirosomataceae bacterium]